MKKSKPAMQKPAMQKPAIQKANVFEQMATLLKKSEEQKLVDTGAPVSPYVQFAHPMAKNYAQMAAVIKGIQTGKPVYVNDSEFIALEPFEFLPTPAFIQYYGRFDDQGKLIDAIEASGRTPDDFREVVNCVIVVCIGDELKPARVRFTGPKTKAIKVAIEAFQTASAESDFANYSKDHARVVKSGAPVWSWQTCKVVVSAKRSKANREYHVAEGTVSLTGLSRLAMLQKIATDEQFNAEMADCLSDYNRECTEITSLISGESEAK